ncbi:hypothetical protein [Bradyrhizobium sp. dw_78]|uniref:hypothetical protein n=1 Tax=Bradyrhizobium sp. dw_78 TaxID=2719793 RepID=UPI001BD32CCF|nr:hypothetical protein [Bradyrhizobium sp. dw_78]
MTSRLGVFFTQTGSTPLETAPAAAAWRDIPVGAACPWIPPVFVLIDDHAASLPPAGAIACAKVTIFLAGQDRKQPKPRRDPTPGSCAMDPLAFRLRHVFAILIAAVVAAAILRHIVHIYGGISREDIRFDALLGAGLVAIAAIIFLRKRRG